MRFLLKALSRCEILFLWSTDFNLASLNFSLAIPRSSLMEISLNPPPSFDRPPSLPSRNFLMPAMSSSSSSGSAATVSCSGGGSTTSSNNWSTSLSSTSGRGGLSSYIDIHDHFFAHMSRQINGDNIVTGIKFQTETFNFIHMATPMKKSNCSVTPCMYSINFFRTGSSVTYMIYPLDLSDMITSETSSSLILLFLTGRLASSSTSLPYARREVSFALRDSRTSRPEDLFP